MGAWVSEHPKAAFTSPLGPAVTSPLGPTHLVNTRVSLLGLLSQPSQLSLKDEVPESRLLLGLLNRVLEAVPQLVPLSLRDREPLPQNLTRFQCNANNRRAHCRIFDGKW